MQGHEPEVIEEVVKIAEMDKAPADSIYRGGDGRWITAHELNTPFTQNILSEYVKNIKKDGDYHDSV